MGALDFMSDNNTNNLSHLINDVIEKGIKQTEAAALFDETKVDRIISEGVKETKGGGYLGSIEMKGKMVHQLESPKQNNEVENVIESGIKLTTFNIPLSEDDGQITEIEDVIQNGIKKTFDEAHHRRREVVRTIRDGIKETHDDAYHHKGRVDGVIKNGVKETELHKGNRPSAVEDTIQNGVKETKSPGADGDLLSTIEWMESNNNKSVPEMIDDVITNGIKETKKLEHDRTTYHGYFSQERGTHTPLDTVQDVLKNGIKHTQPHVLEILNPIGFEPTLKENKRMNEVNNVLDKGIKKTKAMDEWVNTENIINKVIDNGIKEVQPLPAQDGNRDWGDYYYRQADRTKSHIKYVDDAIRDGVKETWGYEKQPQKRIDDVIMNGQKD